MSSLSKGSWKEQEKFVGKFCERESKEIEIVFLHLQKVHYSFVISRIINPNVQLKLLRIFSSVTSIFS